MEIVQLNNWHRRPKMKDAYNKHVDTPQEVSTIDSDFDDRFDGMTEEEGMRFLKVFFADLPDINKRMMG